MTQDIIAAVVVRHFVSTAGNVATAKRLGPDGIGVSWQELPTEADCAEFGAVGACDHRAHRSDLASLEWRHGRLTVCISKMEGQRIEMKTTPYLSNSTGPTSSSCQILQLKMTWEQKMQACQSIGDMAVRMRKPGDWYVGHQGVGKSEGLVIAAGCVTNAATPQDAVEQHWEWLTTYKGSEHIVLNAHDENRREVIWNGFMWQDWNK